MIGGYIRNFLRNREPLLRMVAESPIMFILFRGPEFIIDFANNEVQAILGKDMEEMQDRPFFEVFPDLIGQGYRDIFQHVFQSGETYTTHEMPLQVVPEIEVEYVSFTLHPITGNAGTVSYILGMATKITELIKSRQLIKLNEEKYRTVLEGSDQGYMMLEILMDENNKPYDYIFLEVNPAFERIVQMNNPVGKSVREVIPDIEPFWIETYGNVAITGKDVTVRHETGALKRTYEAHAQRIGGNKSRRVAVLFTDVTDKVEKDKLAERFAEELQLKVAQRTQQLEEKVFELRQFAHVMRHDLREPLRKNKFFLSLLQTSLEGKLNDQEKGYILKMFNGYQRMETILEGVLKYSALENQNTECLEIDLNSVMQLISEDLEIMIENKKAKIIIDRLPHITGITMLTYQLFYNIVFNALKFSRPDVPPLIHIYAKTKSIRSSGFAAIYVRDNGIGFEPHYSKKIFNAFTRLNTKDEFEGTGMGLAISRKIAERLGGTIAAESTPGEGAEFRILLPLA